MSHRRAPRLVSRVLLVSFLTVASVLAAVFVVLSLDARARVRASVVTTLDSSQRLLARVEARRQRELATTASLLAESPTLKAALDTYGAERRGGAPAVLEALVTTVRRELDKLAAGVDADVLAVLDARGRVVAATGVRASAWPRPGTAADPRPAIEEAGERLVVAAPGAFRVISTPLVVDDAVIGALEIGSAVDEDYAREIAALARAETAVVLDGRVLAATTGEAVATALARGAGSLGDDTHVRELDGEAWAVRHVADIGPAALYALTSVDRESSAATAQALRALGVIAAGAVLLAAVASVWLARTIASPIDRLSVELTRTSATASAVGAPPLPATGSSRELDALVEAFNRLTGTLGEAEAATEAAYLGTIRALVASLDARDPYTSGHSERVSALAAAMGRVLGLADADVEVLHLGGLLHDIGKIGVPDHVLRKPEALTAEEFSVIRAHPLIGARIVRSIAFLAPHLPIVELHHERPDGRGYPYGLSGEAIPLVARIVHVADAFDAMTSARAYRPGRLAHEAVSEIVRHRGTDFDPACVDALVAALPLLAGRPAPASPPPRRPRLAAAAPLAS